MANAANKTEPGKGNKDKGNYYAEVALSEILSPEDQDALYREIASMDEEDPDEMFIEDTLEGPEEKKEGHSTGYNSPDESLEGFMSFDDEELKDIEKAVTTGIGARVTQELAEIDDRLKQYINDDDPDDPITLREEDFQALGVFVTSNSSRKSRDILDIIAEQEMKRKQFLWSGRTYNHDPGHFEFIDGAEIRQIATELFGKNHALYLVDENAHGNEEANGGIVPVLDGDEEPLENPSFEISLVAGNRGYNTLLTAKVELKHKILIKSLKGVSDFMRRSAKFLEQTIPYMYNFEQVRRNLGEGAVETDTIHLTTIYAHLIKRHETRMGKPTHVLNPRMPKGEYSVTLYGDTGASDSPLVRIMAGCRDFNRFSGRGQSLSGEGLSTTVERYSDQRRWPRAFEMYLI